MMMQQIKSKTDLIADYYSQHYEEVKTFVSSRLRYSDVAEDIVQNIFLRLLQMDKMITPVTMPGLVHKVATNLIYDYWRHCQYIYEYEHFITKCDGMGTTRVSGESVYSVQEINQVLERGIARLDDNKRAIYCMNIFEGMQVSEIAIKLDVKYKNVEKRLGAARKEIRSYMRRMLA